MRLEINWFLFLVVDILQDDQVDPRNSTIRDRPESAIHGQDPVVDKKFEEAMKAVEQIFTKYGMLVKRNAKIRFHPYLLELRSSMERPSTTKSLR